MYDCIWFVIVFLDSGHTQMLSIRAYIYLAKFDDMHYRDIEKVQ